MFGEEDRKGRRGESGTSKDEVNEREGDVNEKVPCILWETVIEAQVGSDVGSV